MPIYRRGTGQPSISNDRSPTNLPAQYLLAINKHAAWVPHFTNNISILMTITFCFYPNSNKVITSIYHEILRMPRQHNCRGM